MELSGSVFGACFLILLVLTLARFSEATPYEKEETATPYEKEDKLNGLKCSKHEDCSPVSTYLRCLSKGICACSPNEHWQYGQCRLRVNVACKVSSSDDRCVRNGKCFGHEISKDEYGKPQYHDENGLCKCLYTADTTESELCSTASGTTDFHFFLPSLTLISMILKYFG
jgi:hypothetical protein